MDKSKHCLKVQRNNDKGLNELFEWFQPTSSDFNNISVIKKVIRKPGKLIFPSNCPLLYLNERLKVLQRYIMYFQVKSKPETESILVWVAKKEAIAIVLVGKGHRIESLKQTAIVLVGKGHRTESLK